jgi:CheY-like chemotaxis protein
MNLAMNARDAMPNGGTLRLRTANELVDAAMARTRPGLEPGVHVALVVEDTGTGIDPEVLPHLFEPFVTTKGPGKGTGLGLATVYGIVEQSGGHVYAESTPGRGSRFTVLLPWSVEPDGSATNAPATSVPQRGTETILLVEDEAGVRAAIRRMLTRQGYTVLDAASGPEALQLVESSAVRIDLVLTDVVMPGQSGRSLVEHLTARWPGLRVLYMSGYTDDEMLRRGLMQSGTALLEKPFTPDRLADVVRQALGTPSPPRG